MKIKTGSLLIAVILFLISLIVIQFVWIMRTAKYQEKQFEFAVVVALNKAVGELNERNDICSQVIDCFDDKGYACCNQQDLRKDLWLFIDSIIQAELSYGKICLEYEFQLATQPHPHPIEVEDEGSHKCFTTKSSMQTTAGKHIWIHMSFPGRSKFILAQIGWLFIVSIVLILLTIGSFILIYRYFKQEQLLARDTRNFINNLTHEFKTPLASIRLANSRIMKTEECVDVTKAYTKIIKQENNKLDEHINYLLDISRLQKGKMPMNFEVLDVHELLVKQTDSFSLQIEDRKGSLLVNNEANKTLINGDCFHLANAFNNLLDNACKYTKDKPEIMVTMLNKNGSIIIAFSDNGIGIEKRDKKTIFQEFSRVDTGNIHNVKGFGLGLSYVGQIVKLHKGAVWLESNLGEGSTFFIQLPTVDKPLG
ncbi:MAG: HAMP domain-containing sensor histidine kinase [Salinivirgaceae bacterium]|jgi:two-component system phosphate regulon sensor histidine kinase PhoR|nr:HAMP domain-containing sensor histidine kinase [Salinivirgaceae bacterium]